MAQQFYKTEDYRNKQRILTKSAWQRGVFSSLYVKEKRTCKRIECDKIFEVTHSDSKMYCSRSCAAMVNNVKRGAHSEDTKFKIAGALKGRKILGIPNPYRGVIKVPRVAVECPYCKKIFLMERWQHRKFCSNKCSMAVVGSRPTSPKAARGIAGIREDIGSEFYFYSRWEANFARILNLLGIPWLYQCKTFDIGGHMYTPDFYLPDSDTWIEIKNFLSEYSRKRDENFRKMYPDLELMLILKGDYLELQEEFAPKIENWEFS